MRNCTELVMMDVGDNDLDGGIPTWVGTDLVQLRFLILRSNKLTVAIKGSEFEYGTTLDLVTNINLSKNNLSGNIPKELTSLVELRSLNLSRNILTGSIPEKIGDMKQLESLDLSMNALSGHIPKSLALVSFLNYLNISYNKLTGEIPKSTQLVGLDASGFIGNSLCGPPLTRNCRHEGDEVHGHKEANEEDDDDDDKPEIEWVYVLVSLGYAMGFSAVCSALVLNKSWREAYFGLLAWAQTVRFWESAEGLGGRFLPIVF
ncbi:hypothetical protein ACS0TY_014086 [Phlomoides rotata]